MTQEINFVREIPGFKGLTHFRLEINEESLPFATFQSLESEEVGFIVANPFSFFPNYEVNLSEDILVDLDIQSQEDVQLWGIITYRQSLLHSTMNLQAPIVLNVRNEKAAQVIFNDSGYAIRQPLVSGTHIEIKISEALPASHEVQEGGTTNAGIDAKEG